MTTFIKKSREGWRMGDGAVRDRDPPAKLKRFILFAGDDYYPAGGWHDCIGSADSVEDAIKAAADHKHDWWHIIDAETGQEVNV